MSYRGRAVASVPTLFALIVACDGGAAVKPTPLLVSTVDTLRPGQLAQVHGSGLTSLKSLTLDGAKVAELVVKSDSVAEFRVPSMRACETDMRMVKVSADGSPPVSTVVRVPASISLRVAESRVLTESDLQCLRLTAADEDYVLSAANLTIPTTDVEVPRPLVAVRVLGTGDAAASSLGSSTARLTPASVLAGDDADILAEPAISGLASATQNYSQAPVQFDPRYATAVAGDTLRFVDWFSGTPQICTLPAETVPSFTTKVLAVSGNVAVAIDLRHPSAPAFLDLTKLGWLRDAAAMTDKLLLPTMRSLFAADYAPPAGGGGRYYVMLNLLPSAFQGFAGYAYDGPLPTVNVASQANCPRASEMVVSTVSAEFLAIPQNQIASQVAGLFIHEYAHSADLLTSRRDRTASVLNEGLATLAEETASRIGSKQPLRARHAAVGSDAPALTSGALGMWGTSPTAGPWQSNGRYGPNARMLLFLRELAGEASVDHARNPTLYQRLIYAPIDWLNRPAVIAHITTTLGIAYADLTDRLTLASVTAGLIDPGVVHDLPRYTSWDHSERARVSGPLAEAFPGRASRRVNGEYALAAADGGHAALYLMKDGQRGISLELLSMASTSRIVRLTRLR